MNTSISFNGAADFYDSTRELPAAIATQGIQAILEAAGPGARMLDVGTGTGRVSVPLLQRGADLIGCDLARRMMAVLQQKMPSARLAEADAALLPFPAAHFDAVTTCHVMHLVGPWREALREYRRVLRPGGAYINARSEPGGGKSDGDRIQDHWNSRVKAHGASTKRPGVQNPEELHGELIGMGASLQRTEVVRYVYSYSVREVVERIANRINSDSWVVPEPAFSLAVGELREWVSKEYQDPDRVFEDELVFVLDVARFNAAS